MKLTITKRALLLLYFSCYFATLFSVFSLLDLTAIPDNLRRWVMVCASGIVMLLYILLNYKGLLPPLSNLAESEGEVLRIGNISIGVISAKTRFSTWRGVVLAGGVLIWGLVVLVVMQLTWHKRIMAPVLMLLMGASLAMIVDYAEKRMIENVP